MNKASKALVLFALLLSQLVFAVQANACGWWDPSGGSNPCEATSVSE